jgi:hypothetical protein
MEVHAGWGSRGVGSAFDVQAGADLDHARADGDQVRLERVVEQEWCQVVDDERPLQSVLASPRRGSRQTSTTNQPVRANSSATAWPMPRFPPVTTAVGGAPNRSALLDLMAAMSARIEHSSRKVF